MKGEDADVHNNLGLSYFELKNYEEAKNSFNKAINFVTANTEKLEWDENLWKHASSYYSNYAQAQYHFVEENGEEYKSYFFDALEKINEAINIYDKQPAYYFHWGNIY